MLDRFDEICTREGLTYWLHAGTLLGSVRGKDLIPWDDDADLTVPRESFDRIRSMRKDLSDDSIQFSFPEDSSTFYDFIPGFHCDKYIVEQKTVNSDGQSQSFFTSPKIDLFVLDECGNGFHHRMTVFRLLSKYLLARGHRQVKMDLDLRTNRLVKPLLAAIAKLYEQRGSRIEFDKILSKYESISRRETGPKCSYLFISNDQPWSLSKIYTKSMYSETVIGRVGDREYPIPGGYHGVLTEIYGDYMVIVPPDERNPSHYVLK